MKSVTDIVHQFYAALKMQDYSALRRLLHDNLAFRGPIDRFDRADLYLEAIKRLAPITERVDVLKTFADESDVCVLYELVTKTSAGTAFVSEWFKIQGGKIAAIRVVFDARPFMALFAK